VALTGRRDAKGLSERIARHEFILADNRPCFRPGQQKKRAENRGAL
jgi:hypothetical protein